MITTTAGKKFKGFSDEERAAMKERALELKAEADKADGASAVLAKIAAMPEPDRAMAKRLHAIITANAPPRLVTMYRLYLLPVLLLIVAGYWAARLIALALRPVTKPDPCLEHYRHQARFTRVTLRQRQTKSVLS